jgi:hypothetical protein
MSTSNPSTGPTAPENGPSKVSLVLNFVSALLSTATIMNLCQAELKELCQTMKRTCLFNRLKDSDLRHVAKVRDFIQQRLRWRHTAHYFRT